MKNGIVLIPFVDAKTNKSYNANDDFSAKEKRFNELVALKLIMEIQKDDSSDKNASKSNIDSSKQINPKSSDKSEDPKDKESDTNPESSDKSEDPKDKESDTNPESSDKSEDPKNKQSK